MRTRTLIYIHEYTKIYTHMYKIYKQFIAYDENILRFHKTAWTDILYMLFGNFVESDRSLWDCERRWYVTLFAVDSFLYQNNLLKPEGAGPIYYGYYNICIISWS